jgi:hypothetical protein
MMRRLEQNGDNSVSFGRSRDLVIDWQGVIGVALLSDAPSATGFRGRAESVLYPIMTGGATYGPK